MTNAQIRFKKLQELEMDKSTHQVPEPEDVTEAVWLALWSKYPATNSNEEQDNEPRR